MTSLRRTIVVWTTLTLTVVGVLAVIISYKHASEEAEQFLDGQLRQIALNVGEIKPETIEAPGAASEPEDVFLIALRNQGGEIVRSPRDSIALSLQSKSGFSDVNAGGQSWRVYTWITPGRTVQVGQQVAVREELAERAAVAAATPILITIPLAWLVIGWAIKRALEKLEGLAVTISERGPNQMDPISAEGIPIEVRPLVMEMNDLIARLQHVLDQQRQFVSDAAHHLRTPLTALNIQLENLRTAARDGVMGAALSDMASSVRRASKLVDQLLRLARFDALPQSDRREAIHLGTLLTACVAEHIAIATSKGVDLGFAEIEKAEVLGDAEELSILFNNLLENAVRYTPIGGSVDISIRREGAGIVIEVADTGPGVGVEDLPRLSERFFRAASPETEGTGLGLAILSAIAKRHGFKVMIMNRTGGGCRDTSYCKKFPVRAGVGHLI